MADLSRELAGQLGEAHTAGRPVSILGNSSKPWMSPAATAEPLSLAAHRGIVSYDPAELVVSVRAGTPLAELEAALAERGQMLAMEAPDFNGGSTIGGAVALGWAGSRSAFAGGVRDAVLGLRMLNGLGEDLRFGGQVMKNVAGFDISRLMVGSCGRLGAILELSLRVLPLPQQELSLRLEFPDLAASRAAVSAWLRRGYPLSGASYSGTELSLRLSGSPAMLAEARAAIAGEEIDGAYWSELRRLALPMFHHGWGDEKLFDCNGEVCWTAHTRTRGNGPVVKLSAGPQPGYGGDALGQLQQRIGAAFDPAGLFRSGLAA